MDIITKRVGSIGEVTNLFSPHFVHPTQSPYWSRALISVPVFVREQLTVDVDVWIIDTSDNSTALIEQLIREKVNLQGKPVIFYGNPPLGRTRAWSLGGTHR